VVPEPAGLPADDGRLRDLVAAEKAYSAIDELDTMRDEYVTHGIPVPRRQSFTQSKGSAHFSFAELNSGDYGWAIISDRLLAGLETMRTEVGDRILTITSGYRNPAHNATAGDTAVFNSRHQYGDAADVTPTDLNGDGVVDSDDRDRLADAARAANFYEIIK
jgi:hypothetical protein